MTSSLRLFFVIVLALLAEGPTIKAQISPAKRDIHWSEKSSSVSPDLKWRLEVSPQGEDGPAVVSIRRTTDETKHVLFRLQRDASVIWSPDSTSLMVEDRLFSDHYRLMLFHIPFQSQSEQKALSINRSVKAAVKRSLNPGEQINYYLPEAIGWRDGHWLIAVGVTTVRGGSGPFTAHCLGFLVNDRGVITQSLSDSQLKDKFGATCQM